METEAPEPTVVAAGPRKTAEAAPRAIGVVHRPAIAVVGHLRNVADPGMRSEVNAEAKLLAVPPVTAVVPALSVVVPAPSVVVRPAIANGPQVQMPAAGPPVASRLASPPAESPPKAPPPSVSEKPIARVLDPKANPSRLPM